MKVYIAGPMRGIPYYNFPKFDAVAEMLRKSGHIVLNPADMDRAVGFDAMLLPEDSDWCAVPDGFSFDDCVTRDIEAVRQCDTIYLLDGWENSRGACAEKALAEWLGKNVEHEETLTEKPSNPKDVVGAMKAKFSTIPAGVMFEIGLALLEGAVKYGRHNYRAVGVRASVYYDACMGHLADWWEGQDIDPDSSLNHVVKFLASGVVLRDAMLQGKLEDDRPPRSKVFKQDFNADAKRIIEQHANKTPKHYTISDSGICRQCNAAIKSETVLHDYRTKKS